jgi:hypothetical protein
MLAHRLAQSQVSFVNEVFNQESAETVKWINQILSKTHHVQSMHFENTKMTRECFTLMIPCLSRIKSLYFKFENMNYIMPSLTQIMENGYTKQLRIMYCYMEEQALEILARALVSFKSNLLCIDLANIHKGIGPLTKALEINKTLQRISLIDCVNRVQALCIADMLKTNFTWIELNLYRNEEIGDSETRALAKALCFNSHLRVFSLSNPKITAKGIMYFKKTLIRNESLHSLSLEDVGEYNRRLVFYLRKGLERNFSLRKLILYCENHVQSQLLEIRRRRIQKIFIFFSPTVRP